MLLHVSYVIHFIFAVTSGSQAL